jgi:phytoene dehydrogenase-like protein
MSSILVIGGGIAGLSAGCYARMNGYDVTVLEMHDQPGGLCTAWQRKGYTIDGCVHWLVGSCPGSAMNTIWRELGALQGRPIVNHDEFMRVEFVDEPPVVLYTDPDRLEAHLLAVAPEDRKVIDTLVGLVRRFRGFDLIPERPPELMGGRESLSSLLKAARYLPWLIRYDKVSVAAFAAQCRNPNLRLALEQFFIPEMPFIFLIITFAVLARGDAGYPLGGSLEFARAIERRLLGLGGTIRYRARVARVLVEQDRAVGVVLADGTELRADDVVSAGDAHRAIFDLLGGRYADDEVRGYFTRFKPFPPLVYVGLGLDRSLDDVPRSVAGMLLPLHEPIRIGPDTHHRLSFHPYNHDPTLAPPGQTAAVVMFPTDYDHWVRLYADRRAYRAEKKRIGQQVVAALDRRFPGLAADVEMIDVASPMTFERYTGNYRGSFEGWLSTPDNYRVNVRKTLPGLDRFHLAGHWVQPGGGLPPAAFTGKHVIQLLCHRDGRPFLTSLP